MPYNLVTIIGKNMTTRKIIESASAGTIALLCCTLLMTLTTAANSANITAFGDSITASEGSQTGGYPPRIHYLLNINGKPSIVANFGRTGEITSEGVSRLDAVLAAFPANLMLIMEGTNDVHRGIPVEITKNNLQTMINKAKAAGVTPVLSTLLPSDRGRSKVLIPKVWNPMIKDLANSNDIKLVDQYAAVLPSWGSLHHDGIHPNDSGYQVIANTWYSSIASMISSSGAVASYGGGFFAMAALDSSAERYLKLLRDFRDSFLLSNTPGRLLIKWYYRISLPISEYISRYKMVKRVVCALIYPLAGLSYVMLKLTVQTQLALITMTAGAIVLSSTLKVKRYRLVQTTSMPVNKS